MIDRRRFLSLRTRFVIMLVLAVALALISGMLVGLLGNGLIQTVYMSEEACEERCREILDEFETFVTEQDLEVKQGRDIVTWTKKQNKVYLMISDESRVLLDSGWWEDGEYYSVFEEETAESTESTVEEESVPAADQTGIAGVEGKRSADDENFYEESYGYGVGNRPIQFKDGIYLVSVYDYSENSLYEAADAAVIVVMLVVLFGIMLIYHNSVTRRIIALSKEVESIARGNLSDKITVRKGDEIGELADHVDLMRSAIIKEMRAEQEAWNANSDLITRMSHDIRTPLTVLIGFLELLEEGEFSDDEAYLDYLGICKKNAFQMKTLADKLFQYFLVFGHGANKINLEVTDAKVLLHQLLGEHTVLLQEQGWVIQTEMKELEGFIEVDPFHIKRLLDNLFSNVEKYGDPDLPVKVNVWRDGDTLWAEMKNGIHQKPQRAESTNMGLKTCERIAELMNGTFQSYNDGSEFTARLSLPICQ